SFSGVFRCFVTLTLRERAPGCQPQGSRRVVNRCSQVGQVLVNSLVLPVQPTHLVQEPERDGSHSQAVYSERTEQHNQKDFHFLPPFVQHGSSPLSCHGPASLRTLSSGPYTRRAPTGSTRPSPRGQESSARQTSSSSYPVTRRAIASRLARSASCRR